MPGVFQLSPDELTCEAAGPGGGRAGGVAVRHSGGQGRRALRGLMRPRASLQKRCAGSSGSCPPAGHHRCLPVRVYGARALRHGGTGLPGARVLERPDPEIARAHGGQPRRGRSGHGRAQDMMDGRVRRDPRGTGPRRASATCPSCPTRRSSLPLFMARFARPPSRPPIRRPPQLPDGPGQRRRGAARGGLGYPGRGRTW